MLWYIIGIIFPPIPALQDRDVPVVLARVQWNHEAMSRCLYSINRGRKSCVKSTVRPQSLLQHFIISIICILQLESSHLAGLIGGRAWGAMSLCLWETCCMLYLCFLNNFQHSMMPSFTSMVYLWTLCFFPFIVMLHAFNCSVYFDNINLPCKVISLVCLHFYVHR